MKRSKTAKFAALALGFALAASALAGCSTSDTSSGSGKTLTLGTDDASRVTKLVSAFEKANPGVKVKVIASGAAGYEEFMRTRITAGTAPDVIRVFPGSGGNTMTVGQLSKAGLLQNLNDQGWVSKLNASQKSLFRDAKGQSVAVPAGATALAPVWNNAAMSEIGAKIPTSYEDLLALCKTARDKGKVVFSLGQKDLFVTQLTPYAMVADSIYGPTPEFGAEQLAGKRTFAKSKWVQAYSDLLEMRADGCFNDGENGTSYDEAMKMMGSGAALAQVTFADLSTQQAAAAAGTTFTMTPWPAKNGGKAYLSVADSYGFAVSKKAKNLTLAEKFTEFLGSAAGQNAFAEGAGFLPSIPNKTFKPSSPVQQTVADYIAKGQTAIWPDNQWTSPDVQQAMFTGVQQMFDNSATPESVAASMDAAYAAALNK